MDREALFQHVIPNTFIDWEYVKGQTLSSAPSATSTLSSVMAKHAGFNSYLALVAKSPSPQRNLLGDSSVWLQLMQFLDFGELKIPERLLQKQYPPLFCMYMAVMSQSTSLNFSDVCKLLILNNVEGLSTRNITEMHTSTRLKCNTYTLCNHIVNALADERHSSEVYEATFR